MQRVSALLPIWDRSKSAASDSNAPAAQAATAKRLSTSSSGSAANSTKNARPTTKVFSWGQRFGGAGGKNLSASSASAASVPSGLVPSTPMGREAYWPTNLDRECEKAARILKSFCTDGFLDEEIEPSPASPTSRGSITSLTAARFPRKSSDVTPASPTLSVAPRKKKIPPSVIQDAVGLAIFSCMRSGLWMSGSGGSGILIARKADGTWSPPSGILLHTSAVAFVVGVDIYDCVLVINSVAALEMFTHPRLTLGADVPLTVGPLVPLGQSRNEIRWNNELNNTVLTYLKARGHHSPAQLSGSLVTERSNENERFYTDDGSGMGVQRIDILDILAGNIRKSIPEILPLYEAIKAAEGRIDFDQSTMDQLSLQPAPGDADIAETPVLLSPVSPQSATFGVPDATDPDPFGIIALEMAGMEIREAGSKHRPTSSQFDYAHQSPTSPVFAQHMNRQSVDATLEQGNRASYLSTRTQATSMTDACTQTDVAETPDTSLSPSHSDDGKEAQAAAQQAQLSIPELSLPVEAETAPATAETIRSANGNATVSDSCTQVASTDILATTEAIKTPRPKSIVIERPRSIAIERPKSVTIGRPKSIVIERPKSAVIDRAVLAPVTVVGQTDSAKEPPTSEYVEDERNEDADDEDEETDGVGEEAESADFDDDDDDDDEFVDMDDEEEPVVFEVATTTQPVRAMPVAQVIQAKGALVNIPKRVPPPLPLRSPARASRARSDFGDLSMVNSPLRNSFQSAQTEPVTTSRMDSPEPESYVESRIRIAVEDASPTTEPSFVAAIPLDADKIMRPVSVASSAAYESAPDITVAEENDVDLRPEWPLTSQATEPAASSTDEFDGEPKTPRPEDVVQDRHSRSITQEETPKSTTHLSASGIAVA